MKKLISLLALLCALTVGPFSAFAQNPEQIPVPFDPYSLTITPPAGFFTHSIFEPDLTKPDLVSVPTALTDTHGTFYYLISDRDNVLAEAEITDPDDLETMTFSFSIYAYNASGNSFMFCKGRLPLKSYPAGLTFDHANGRLLLFIRTLAVDTVKCDFLILDENASATPPEGPKAKSVATVTTDEGDSSDTGLWDLSSLEPCFKEQLSIIQIFGQFEALSQI